MDKSTKTLTENKMHHDKKPPQYINNIADTVVLESPIHSYGLFATKNIKKETLLCELSGQIVSDVQYEKIIKSDMFPKETFIEKHIDVLGGFRK